MRTNRPGGLKLTRRALEFCRFNPRDPVLDAGCGLGATAAFLQDEKGLWVMGLDGSLDRLKTARTHQVEVPEPGTGFPGFQPGFIQARLPGLPFRPGVFQGIFCECVLSLVRDKTRCLDEFYRALAPGGTLVLSDLFLPGEKPWQKQGSPVTCLDGCLDLTGLQTCIKAAGFTIEHIEDHTRLLKEMACEMVFKHGSLENFWQTLGGDLCRPDLAALCRTGCRRPGYCLIIAHKPVK